MSIGSALGPCIGLHQAGRLEEAVACYRALLSRHRGDAQLNHLLGVALFALGRAEEAHRHLRSAAQRAPGQPQVLNDMGNVLRALQRQAEAVQWFRKAILADRGFAFARFNLADCLLEMRRLPEALAAYDDILAARLPGIDADVHAHRALCLAGLGRHEAAAAAARAALDLDPRHGVAAAQYGAALQALGRDEEAVAFLGALPQPGVEVRLTLGRGLLNLRRHAQALAVFEDVLRADPRSAKALVGRGLACAGLGRGEEALRCFDAAAALDPASAEALSNRAVTLKRLGRLAEAAASAEAALRIAPENLDARINLGNAQSLLGEHAAAVANLRLAVARDGTSRDAQMNLGNALYHAQEIAAAIPHFAAAAQGASGPLAVQALASLTFARLQCCDWTGLADARAALVEAIGRDEGWGAPFAMLSIVDDPAIHHACAARQLREAFPIARRVVAPAPAGGRIRVGYFSSDLRVHAVGQAMARLLELHDRSAFEIHAFAIGRPVQDALRTRIAAGVEHFHECGGLADDAVLALAREVGLDIAVDLNGHTGNARTALFAQGLAPVQVNYLGYPGTMGAPFMDYILADATVIPEGAEAAFSEAVVRLPDTYLPTDDRREISETPLTREDAGLPSGAFVFCVFNNGYKIQPEAFAIWMRLLAQVPGAVLWLREEQPLATRNLRAAAADHGIDPARLVFAGKVPHPEHLARHRLADLFLDALPYNAHTTAADALGAGLPVLTQAGRAFAGRVGASLLQAVGLPELVTTSPEAHERLALDLATDPARLGAIRQRLAARLPVAPLFDTPRLARAIERAFAAMQARALAGLPPAGFTVARPPGPG